MNEVSNQEIHTVMIYGYGVMGRAVAKTFAGGGYTTLVKDVLPIDPTTLPVGVVLAQKHPEKTPDIIVEFVPETIAAKRAAYAEIEATYSAKNIIIATGTSGLDLVELASGLRSPENFLGLHYFMPADTSRVVEVMAGPATSREIVDLLADVVRQTGKEPVRLYKPVVGYLLNRLQHAILHEAYYLIQNGVATAADIDRAAQRLFGPRMCVNGLLRQKDIGGLQIHADAQRSIVPELYHNGIPSPMLQSMVARGETGLAAGKGFYEWTGYDVEAVRRQSSSRLEELMNFIDEHLEH